jgi:hypothetical protein
MKRLLEGDGSEVERGLLDALRLERPSPELEERMRAAIGLAAMPAPAPEPSTPTTAAVPAVKTAGWGAIAAGAAVIAGLAGGVLFLLQGGTEAEGSRLQAPPPALRATPAKTPEVSTPKPEATPAIPAEELEPVPAPAKLRPQQAPVAPPSASLREEIRLIDSARMAVKKHDRARALGILDQYTRRFPDGAFTEEARVLRAEAVKHR